MYGAMEFFDEAKSYGIKPILGCEITVSPHNATDNFSEGIDPDCSLVHRH